MTFVETEKSFTWKYDIYILRKLRGEFKIKIRVLHISRPGT